MRHEYRADIDGLRALAVSAVVAFHYVPSLLPGGYVGVDIFFVISGFLITRIIAGELETGTFTYAGFYGRRVRRIAPALILVVAATLVAGWFILWSGKYAELGRHVAASALFVTNFVLWSEAGYFDPAAHAKPLLHLWSLAVEEQFYIVWPVILTVLWRSPRSLRVWILAALAAASLAACIVVTADNPTAGFYSPLTRLWQLALGGWVAIVSSDETKRPWLPANALAIGGLALIAASFGLFDAYSSYPGWRALLPTCGAAMVIAAGPLALPNRWLLGNRLAVWIGLISYPLYLWHWPIISFGFNLSGQTGDGLLPRSIRALMLVSSIALAWATYRFVELPIRLREPRFVPTAALVGAIPAFVAVGLALHLAGGLPERPVARDPRVHFVERYQAFLGDPIAGAYRKECDFFDWDQRLRKAGVDPSCTTPGPKETWLLWGDSHAQALSLAIRTALPDGIKLAQVATSGCRPSLGPIDYQSPANACDTSNAFVRRTLAELKPSVLVLAQSLDHEAKDWAEIARFAKEAGVRDVVLIGPLPQWTPSLPKRIVRESWESADGHPRLAPDAAVAKTDRILAERFAGSPDLTYVSLIAGLCEGGLCRTTLPGDSRFDLIAYDYGHLTPDGAVYVGRNVLAEPLRRLASISPEPDRK